MTLGQESLNPWWRDPRVFVPVLVLVSSFLTPVVVVSFHQSMPPGVQNLLFFWPQYGLLPYAYYFRVLKQGGYGGNPLGVPGVVTSTAHWIAIV